MSECDSYILTALNKLTEWTDILFLQLEEHLLLSSLFYFNLSVFMGLEPVRGTNKQRKERADRSVI